MLSDQPTRPEDRQHDETLQALKAVLATGHGTRVVFWLLEQAGVYRDPFGGGHEATNYVLGQQSIGRKLIALMDQIDPRAYPQLLLDLADKEAMARAAGKQDDDDAP